MGIRKNVLRLVECLTPTVSFDVFMDNYFTSFRLLTQLAVNNTRSTGVLSKNRLDTCSSHFDKRTSSQKAV